MSDVAPLKVLQIVPADGVVALYERGPNVPVLLWALVEDGDGARWVEGLTLGPGDDGPGVVPQWTESGGALVGLAHSRKP